MPTTTLEGLPTYLLCSNSSLTKHPSTDWSESGLEGILTAVPECPDCICSAREKSLPGETDDVDQTLEKASLHPHGGPY